MRQAKALVRSWVKVTKSKAGQSKVILKRVVLEQVVRQLNTRLKKNEVEGDWMVYRVQVIFLFASIKHRQLKCGDTIDKNELSVLPCHQKLL